MVCSVAAAAAASSFFLFALLSPRLYVGSDEIPFGEKNWGPEKWTDLLRGVRGLGLSFVFFFCCGGGEDFALPPPPSLLAFIFHC